MKISELLQRRLTKLRTVCRTMKYSLRTERSYCAWVRRFVRFASQEDDFRTASPESLLRHFLEHSAGHWSASTQNQALCALVFYYKHIVERPLGQLGEWAAATRPKLLPTWLSHEDVLALLCHLRGLPRLMAQVAYGSGARSNELARLRVKDIDFTGRTITVRGGKGNKDRVTILADSVIPALREHFSQMRALWEADRRMRREGVEVPSSKFNGEEWQWFWLWASDHESRDPRSGIVRRHHIHESTLGKALAVAVKRWGGNQRVTVHSLRHSFATSLLMEGTPIQDVQALLGHTNIATTQIYAHCLPRVSARVRSPMDAAPGHNKIVRFGEFPEAARARVPPGEAKQA